MGNVVPGRCRKANSDTEIERLNVFDADLPPFAADAAHAKFALIFQEKVTDGRGA